MPYTVTNQLISGDDLTECGTYDTLAEAKAAHPRGWQTASLTEIGLLYIQREDGRLWAIWDDDKRQAYIVDNR